MLDTKVLNKEEVISISNGDYLVMDGNIVFIDFELWLELSNTTIQKLKNDLDKLNKTVIDFVGFINRFNRANGGVTLLPVFKREDNAHSYHGFYGLKVENFDSNYNYVLPSKVKTLKEVMNQYLFSISISSVPYHTATKYDFKSLITAINNKLNIS